MRMFSRFSYVGLPAFFLLLFAAPAFAQFEVSPDHFDGPPPANTKTKTASTKKAHTPTNSSNQAAAGKLSTAKTHRATSASGPKRKSQPGTNNSASSAAPKGNAGTRSGTSTSSRQAAPSLKAQAVPVHRE
jgi:cytoskeletal protein RodZ